MATGRGARRPFLVAPGQDRGPFSLPSLSDAYGWGGHEQEREIYLRAVPNATDDQLQTGVGVWYRLSETLGGRSLEDQARIVLAFPFVSQDLVLAGGVGPETRRVTERYPAVTLEELRDTIGAAAGEIRRGTAGIHSRRASAAEAREAIRDMKGATLAALERIQDEDSEAAAAYLEALRASAREIRTAKATKAELAAVARLVGAALPSDVDSWSQVKKARLKDLLEEHLEAEINPADDEGARTWESSWATGDPSYPEAARAEIDRVRLLVEELRGLHKSRPRLRAKIVGEALESIDTTVLFEEDVPRVRRLPGRVVPAGGSTFRHSSGSLDGAIGRALQHLGEMSRRYHRAEQEYTWRPVIARLVFAEGPIPFRTKADLFIGAGDYEGSGAAARQIAEEIAASPYASPEERDRALWLFDSDARNWTGVRADPWEIPLGSQMRLFNPSAALDGLDLERLG